MSYYSLDMELSSFAIFISGLVVIVLGSELLLRGASWLAAWMGIRPMVIGLTVVSVGTSAPELAVGLTAVSQGIPEIAIGNIAGTNMVNLLLILGLSAALRPLPLQSNSIRLDVPFMIFSALLILVMAINGVLSIVEGWILFILAVVYTIFLLRASRKESWKIKREYSEEYSQPVLVKGKTNPWLVVWNAVLLIGGIILAIIGSDLLVNGASEIARKLGVSEAIIALTIVAIGTSAPELVTTIVATIKNDRDVAIGNLIGSSIYNILVILGLTAGFSSDGIAVSKDLLMIDLPLAALAAIVCYPVFKSSKMVTRKEGIFFVTCYVLYITSLIIFRT